MVDAHGMPSTPGSGATRLEHLELALDRLLAERPPQGPPSERLLAAAQSWSEAAWALAEEAGPLALEEEEIERGLELASRPVFVCGVHRSGTSLVRNLLDGHPALSVLPSEGSFLTHLEPRLRRASSDQRRPLLGTEWLRRLANPTPGPSPRWVLGRSGRDRSPYVRFARALVAWLDVGPRLQRPGRSRRFGGAVTLWPLVAVALAYTSCREGGRGVQRPGRWVEKTPTNERHVDRLLAEFPAAKVVHLVRDPMAVLASRKRIEERATGSFNARRTLRDLAASYGIALERFLEVGPPARRGGRAGNYLVVRYEELCDHPERVVARIAAFLEVEPLPTLWRPTIAGLPAGSNSSYEAASAPDRIVPAAGRSHAGVLTASERQLVAAHVGELARRIGYDVPSVGAWRARTLRIRHRLW